MAQPVKVFNRGGGKLILMRNGFFSFAFSRPCSWETYSAAVCWYCFGCCWSSREAADDAAEDAKKEEKGVEGEVFVANAQSGPFGSAERIVANGDEVEISYDDWVAGGDYWVGG